MRKLLRLCGAVGLAGLLASCAGRQVVVIDSAADVVRLGKGVRGPVYVQRGGAWVFVGEMELPAGWFAGPAPLDP